MKAHNCRSLPVVYHADHVVYHPDHSKNYEEDQGSF